MKDRKCDFLVREGLARREAGQSIDDHLARCEECRLELEGYRALEAEIARAGDGLVPPLGWQGRVWTRLAKRRGSRRRESLGSRLAAGLGRGSPSWRPAVALAAVALVAVSLVGLTVAFLALEKPPPGDEPTLVAWLEAGEGARRGVVAGDEEAVILEARPGDRLFFRHRETSPYSAFLIYRDEELLFYTTAAEPTRYNGHRQVHGQLTLTVPGTYRVIQLGSARPLPKPGAGLDRDVAAAIDAGADVEWGPTVEVR